MIIGIGSDIVDMRRMQQVLARYPRRFPRYILTPAEQQHLPASSPALRFLAGRWAAKEALGKAVGCGLRTPLTFRQITVTNDAQGRPHFIFTAPAENFIQQHGIKHCHLSISHDGNYACAMVVAEGAAK